MAFGDGLGGGLGVGANGTVSLTSTTFQNDTAVGALGEGGGVYSATGAVVSTSKAKFKKNSASTSGDDSYAGGTIS